MPVEGKGAVHSYTEVHHAIQPAFKAHTPYLVLLVDLDTQKGKPTKDEALRVVGNLTTPDGKLAPPDMVKKVGIGTRVRMVFADVGAGARNPALDDRRGSEPACQALALSAGVMPNRLILDTDGGVDDAQALLLLIANGRAPDAITTVFGNVDLEAATRNVLATLAVVGADIPVHQGAAEPLVQEIIHAKHVHGEDGLGGAPRPGETGDVASFDGVDFLVATLNDAAAIGERVDLLTIGPLTNLALALEQAPSIVDGIGQLTIMGGTVYGRGNVTPAAEFNIFADPEAAAVVFRAALDTVVVPWEPCVSAFHSGR